MVSLVGKDHGGQHIMYYSGSYITHFEKKIWILMSSSILVVIPSLDTLKFLTCSLKFELLSQDFFRPSISANPKTITFAINVYSDVFS